MNAPESGRPARMIPLPLPLFPLQPILARIVRRVAAENPSMFNRLGPWVGADYIIDPINLPFALHLRPDREKPILRAVSRRALPPHAAHISGKFLDLLELIDADLDGDALFFSRALVIEGNTEAVVSLRNALDDIDGSIAERVAGMFGAPGRAALAAMRRAGERARMKEARA